MLALAPWLQTALDIGSWALVWILILGGLVGTFLPILPGTLLIFLGAVAHFFLLGPENSIELTGFIVLGVLLALSFIADFFSSLIGAKWFGASRWGAIGALAGAIVGLFFGIPGLIVGPILGAVLGEVILAKKKLKPASKSGWGTIVGATAGLVAKVIIALWMVGWILFDLYLFEG